MPHDPRFCGTIEEVAGGRWTTPAVWTWTARRRACLDLFIEGVSRREIGRRVGAHRNSVNRWCAAPEFVIAFRKAVVDQVAERQLRRLREATSFSDRSGRLLRSLLAAVERDPADEAAAKRCLEVAREVRAWMKAERLELADAAGES